MTLIDDLADYDGTTVATLEAIADRYEGEPAALSLAARLAVAPEGYVASGATWLLRRWLERGAVLESEEVVELGQRLGEITSDWARLHVCQAIGALDVPQSAVPDFSAFLREAAASDRPFLRAWGMDGLVRLARAHTEFEAEARNALERAASDPAASVRARARRILAE